MTNAAIVAAGLAIIVVCRPASALSSALQPIEIMPRGGFVAAESAYREFRERLPHSEIDAYVIIEGYRLCDQ